MSGSTSEESKHPAPKSEEAKVAKLFIKGISILTFNPHTCATVFALAPAPVQQRLMFIFRAWLDLLEGSWDRGQHGANNDMWALQREAKRLNEGMLPYEE